MRREAEDLFVELGVENSFEHVDRVNEKEESFPSDGVGDPGLELPISKNRVQLPVEDVVVHGDHENLER